MSSDAIGWVFKYSPYSGSTFAIHLAIADSVNDQGGYEFWMRQALCARKARCGRPAANQAIKRLLDDRFLQLVRVGNGGANRYRFMMPTDAVLVFDAFSGSRRNAPTDPAQGVASANTSCSETEHPLFAHDTEGVASANTEPKGTQAGSQTEPRGRKRRLPSDFEVTDRMREWARDKVASVDIDEETPQFIDHWTGNGTPMIDWEATWRKWMRNAAKFDRRRPKPRDAGRARVVTLIHEDAQ